MENCWLSNRPYRVHKDSLFLSQTLLLCFEKRTYAWNICKFSPDQCVALTISIMLNLDTFYIWIWSWKWGRIEILSLEFKKMQVYWGMAFSIESSSFYVGKCIHNFLLVSKQLGRMHLSPWSLSDFLLALSVLSSIPFNMVLIYA